MAQPLALSMTDDGRRLPLPAAAVSLSPTVRRLYKLLLGREHGTPRELLALALDTDFSTDAPRPERTHVRHALGLAAYHAEVVEEHGTVAALAWHALAHGPMIELAPTLSTDEYVRIANAVSEAYDAPLMPDSVPAPEASATTAKTRSSAALLLWLWCAYRALYVTVLPHALVALGKRLIHRLHRWLLATAIYPAAVMPPSPHTLLALVVAHHTMRSALRNITDADAASSSAALAPIVKGEEPAMERVAMAHLTRYADLMLHCPIAVELWWMIAPRFVLSTERFPTARDWTDMPQNRHWWQAYLFYQYWLNVECPPATNRMTLGPRDKGEEEGGGGSMSSAGTAVIAQPYAILAYHYAFRYYLARAFLIHLHGVTVLPTTGGGKTMGGLVPTGAISLAVVDRAFQEACLLDAAERGPDSSEASASSPRLQNDADIWLALALRIARERIIQRKWGYSSPNGADAHDAAWCHTIVQNYLAEGKALHALTQNPHSNASLFVQVYHSGVLLNA